MTYEEKRAEFLARIERGEKIEATDWMPDDYRRSLIRLIAMHGLSEIMGALPEKEWVPKAPTLQRKLAIMAKVQDEVGHGQLLIRVAEDLVAPLGKNRDDLFEDLFAGRLHFHNVFHMATETWADAGVISWLVDGAAIITQGMLLSTSYAPYARALQRIVAEESFHIQNGEAICLALAEGTKQQRAMLQDALNRWWEALIFFFGPPPKSDLTKHQDINMLYKIRTKTNEELRQRFFSKYVPRLRAIGLTIPDPNLEYDSKTGVWNYTQPDWEKFKKILNNDGPMSKARLTLRHSAWEQNRWVREVLSTRAPLAV